MRIAYFTHSLRSCWNHGNAHFLRGILRELRARGHHVRALEPESNWSLDNLRQDGGEQGLDRTGAVHRAPTIRRDPATAAQASATPSGPST